MKKLLHSSRYKCIIHHFADGDTCQILVECDHCFIWQLEYLRIRGIESHELRSRDGEKARETAKRLTNIYHGVEGELCLTQTSSDKYGRMVGDIQIHGKMLSETLVDLGFAWYTRRHPSQVKSEE